MIYNHWTAALCESPPSFANVEMKAEKKVAKKTAGTIAVEEPTTW